MNEETTSRRVTRRLAPAVMAGLLLTGMSSPAFAVTDGDITLGDSTCQLAGSGTSSSPYLVATPKQLQEVADCSAHNVFFEQTADLDLTPASDGTTYGDWNDTTNGGWVPVGDYNNDSTLTFASSTVRGVYDGAGHSITNLTIERTDADHQALFGYGNVSVFDLTVGSSTAADAGSVVANGNSNYVAAVVGQDYYGQMHNVHVVGTSVAGDSYVGGLAGYASGTSITNVSNSGNVGSGTSALDNGGGIVGYGLYGNIKGATFSGVLQADLNDGGTWSYDSYNGGIIGQMWYGNVTDVHMTGEVNASYYAGGILGYGGEGTIDSAEVSGPVRGSYGTGNDLYVYEVGGIAGYWEEGAIQHSTVSGDVTADTDLPGDYADYFGGIAGYIDYATISHTTVSGDVKVIGSGGDNDSSYYIGGVLGYGDYSGIYDSIVEGDVVVTDAYDVGGIIGYATSGIGILRSQMKGSVEATIVDNTTDVTIGGIAGFADSTLIASSSMTGDHVSSTPSATASKYVGGIIGMTGADGSQILDSYSRANVSGYDYVGGMFGYCDDYTFSVIHTYSTGTVSAENTGATVDVVGSVDPSYAQVPPALNTYDTTTTGYSSSATGAVGHATAAMKSQSTYEGHGFDFESDHAVWAIASGINDGYPYLIDAPAGSTVTPTVIGQVRDSFGPVKFAQFSSVLSKKNKAKLDLYVAAIKTGGYTKVTIKSYTRSANTWRATLRAKVVAKYLKKKGITVTIKKEAVTRDSKKLNNKVVLVATGS